MADEARSEPMTSGSDEGEEPPPNGSEKGDEATQDVLKKKATRTLKIFRQIAECLEKDVVVEIKEMMSQVMTISSKADDDDKEENLTRVYLRFLDKVEFRAGISVNLIAQAIRCFMMIEEDTEGLGETVSQMYLEMILTDHPSLAIDMELTDELLKVYFKLLGEGYEEIQHIRLMVVGMFGVGKTTLVRRLCGNPTDDVTSTVGIDIFLDLCEVKEDLDWEISDPKRKEKLLNQRLQELITKYRKEDKKIPHDTSSVTPSHVQKPKITARMQSNKTFEEFREKVTKKDQHTGYKIVDELKENCNKKEEPLKRRPTVSIWDFAGQSVYYSTHHFFLNARSIYILVLDLSKGLYDKVKEDDTMNARQNLNLGNITEGYTCLDTFKFWMKSIYIYTKQKKASLPNNQKIEYKPKIILVGTFKDKISDETLKGRNKEKYRDDYFNKALCSFVRTPIIDLVHRKFFLISNKDSEENDFLSIKKEIYTISKLMPFWNEKVPAKFIPLERAVFQHKQENKNTMKFSELKKVGHDVEYPNTDESEIKLFLYFQHAFGNVLYYDIGTHTAQDDMSDPSEMIILTPQWIINVFKAFVTHINNAKEMDSLKRWEKFKNLGQLPNDLIDVLLQHINFNNEHKGTILMYMEYLDVIVKPVVFRAENDKDSCTPSASSDVQHHFFDSTMKSPTKEKDNYIMPCMLPARPPMDRLKQLYKEPDDATHYTPTLCLYIKDFLPAFIFHRLLATALKEIPIAVSYGKELLFNGLGSFNLNLSETWMLTIWYVDNIIHLRVTFKGACKEVEDKITLCKGLRGRFEKLVLDAFSFHGKGTYDEKRKAELFDLMVKCPGCEEQVPFDEKKDPDTEEPIDYMIGLHSVENLRIVKEKKCRCCNKVITIEKALKYWFAVDQQPVGTDDFTPEQMGILENSPDNEWKLVALVDEIKDSQSLASNLNVNTESIKRDYWNSHKKQIYYILYTWKKRGDCWKMLYNALKPADIKRFFRIIQGEMSAGNKNKINEYMKQIKKKRDDIIDLKGCQIASLSTSCIGEEYYFFGIQLCIPEIGMQQIEHSYPKDMSAKVRSILTAWNKKNEPIRKFIRSVVLSGCEWCPIMKILNDASAS